MKLTPEIKLARVKNSLYTQGIPLFDCKSGYADSNATANLQGRTHYADEATLRYFKSSILESGHSPDGLLFWLVESVKSRPDHGGHTRRAVVFDVFGEVVNDRAGSVPILEWYKDTNNARIAALAFVKTFDALGHTQNEIRSRLLRQINTARLALAALAGKSS
jgi:hypothetical protein